jgi:hypothetical protein
MIHGRSAGGTKIPTQTQTLGATGNSLNMRQSLNQLQSAILRRFETPFLLSLVGKLWRKLDLVETPGSAQRLDL